LIIFSHEPEGGRRKTPGFRRILFIWQQSWRKKQVKAFRQLGYRDEGWFDKDYVKFKKRSLTDRAMEIRILLSLITVRLYF
jgi:hypothetical protein